MKKTTLKLIVLFNVFFAKSLFSQIGINTTDPQATLDIFTTGNTGATKSLKVNNSDNQEIFTLTDQGRLGIGQKIPDGQLHISTTGINGIISERSTSGGTDFPSYINLRRNRSNDPTVDGAVITNDLLGAVTFSGNTGNGYLGQPLISNSSLVVRAAENFTDEAQGSSIEFMTVPIGTIRNATRMKITSQGRVGMGVTTPESALHVSHTDATGIFAERSSTNDAPSYLNFRKNKSADSNLNGAVVNNDVLGMINFQGNSGNGYLSNIRNGYTSIESIASEDFKDTAQGSSLVFNTVPLGTTRKARRMTITSQGRVGIGTTTPESALHVSHTDATGIFTERSSTNEAPSYLNFRKNKSADPNLNGAVVNNDVLGIINFQGNSGNGYLSSVRTGYTSIESIAAENFTNTSQGSNLQFSTVPVRTTTKVARMTITSQGRIGVGTSTPQSQFHVVTANADGIISERASTNASSPPYLALKRNRSTDFTVNTAVRSGDSLGVITFAGNTGNGYEGDALSSNTSIQVLAAEDFTRNTQGSSMSFRTVATGTASSVTRMTISSGGLIGLGRNPTTNRLEVDGNASKTTAGAFIANSDARLKKDIKPISGEEALNKLSKLEGVTYYWNDDKTGIDRPKEKQIGFIAQNIQQVFPEKVTTDKQGYLQTAYGDYDAIFVESIKTLNNKIQELTDRIEKLEKENSYLKDK